MAVAIALADDSVIVREGVARVLAAQPDMEVVVSCGDLPSLLEAVESERPDVVVTDIRMPPTSTDEGIRAAVLLREQHPDIGVVVLSNYAEPAYAMALLRVRLGGPRLSAQGAHPRPRATGGGDRVGRRRRLRAGLQDRRTARRRTRVRPTPPDELSVPAQQRLRRDEQAVAAPAAAAGLRRKAAPGHSA